jgi:FkbM family methyltransferase
LGPLVPTQAVAKSCRWDLIGIRPPSPVRTALFYNPRLLIERISEEWNRRHRLRRLRGTCAHWLNQYQVESLELIERASSSGARVFYDIGANIGSWTALCRAVVPESVIVAFEPMPEHVAQFQTNTREFAHIQFFPVALGSREETREFHPASASDASSFLPLSQAGRSAWNLENRPALRLPLTTLDKLVASEKLPPPDVIKLDVQGFELEVLRGATGSLRQARWVLSEVSFKSFYEGQVLFSELAGFLAAHGYEVCAFGQPIRPGAEIEQADVLFRRRD